MPETHYLVVGASHAALEAITAIRFHDPDPSHSITVLAREAHRPYSPTVLPYVVSGRARPERLALRPETWFAEHAVDAHYGDPLTTLDPTAKIARTAAGAAWRYEKLLLATGATPRIPPVPGLDQVRFHVLRTLDDALGLRTASYQTRRAVVLGAGLVGLHAAENLAHAGASVTVVERLGQVLPGYLDAPASALVEASFRAHGISLCLGRSAASVAPGADGHGVVVTLDDGTLLPGDLLLVGTGVAPACGYLAGSGIATDAGILVDDTLRTSAADVWAAGDVAQARSFFGGLTGQAQAVGGILPDAVEQGRIAGMDMAGDPALKPYSGGVPINTYSFFGRQAISVGIGAAAVADETERAGITVHTQADAGRGTYCRLAFQENRLLGACTVDVPIDAGVLWQLILRRVDLGSVLPAFCADPLATSRRLMSRLWR